MTKKTRNKRNRFEGVNLDTLNEEIAKVTGKSTNDNKLTVKKEELTVKKRGKGRPKSSTRQPLNTAIEPKNRQRLEFLAMLNGGSVADQLNNILERYFTEIEKIDKLIDLFEEQKRKK